MEKRKEKDLKSDQFLGSINFAYDDIQMGRTINIGYLQMLPTNFAIYAALKYHINTPFYRDYTITKPYYFNQFRPETLDEHIGLTLGLEKIFKISNANLLPFLFYEFQGMNSTVSNLVNLDYIFTGTGKPPRYKGLITIERHNAAFRKYGPVWALENYIGAGTRMKISEHLNLKLKAGIGYNIYLGPKNFQPYDAQVYENHPPKYFENVPWTAKKSEISRMFSVGLEYKIRQRK